MANYQQIKVADDGNITHVRFVSNKIIDAEPIQKMGEELLALLEKEQKKNLLLDFDHVAFLSSAALGKLIKLNNRVREAKGKLRLAAIRPEIYEVFRITKLDEQFSIHDSVEDARAAF
ncbi:MAG TPA: STAS domain-containing protein [Pirellulaceae bacterium]